MIEIAKRKKIFLALALALLCTLLSTFTFSCNALTANDTGGLWVSRTSMPTARVGLGAAVVDGKIYAIGGYTEVPYGYSGINEQYNPTNNSWIEKQPMPTGTTSIGITVYQNKIYVIGGTISNPLNRDPLITGANMVYDTATDTWTSKTPMPQPLTSPCVNTVGDKIYVMGGGNSLTQVYDPETDTWSNRTSIPSASRGYYAASAVIGNKIYIIDDLGLNQIYNVDTDTWTAGKAVPIPVRDAAAAATTGTYGPPLIYLIGGFTDHLDVNIDYLGLNFTQIYTPQNDSWTTGPALPTGRYDPAVISLNDTIFVLGGSPILWSEHFLAANEQFIPSGNPAEPTPSPSPTPTSTESPTPTATLTAHPTQSSNASPAPTATIPEFSSALEAVLAAVLACTVLLVTWAIKTKNLKTI